LSDRLEITIQLYDSRSAYTHSLSASCVWNCDPLSVSVRYAHVCCFLDLWTSLLSSSFFVCPWTFFCGKTFFWSSQRWRIPIGRERPSTSWDVLFVKEFNRLHPSLSHRRSTKPMITFVPFSWTKVCCSVFVCVRVLCVSVWVGAYVKCAIFFCFFFPHKVHAHTLVLTSTNRNVFSSYQR
jgi:hypothetical protein